jgi:two-component system phosphate regulon response regulator PhoB
MPSLIILDIMIPGLDGIALCKKLKDTAETKEIKIIFLSAKGEEQDIIRGLEIGADDYVTKPFSPKILMARVKTVLKRDGQAQFGKVLFQGIMLDDTKRKTTIDDNEVTLTVSEFQILKLLMSSPGHVFARNQIVNSIKGHNHAVTDRSVDTQLVSLRKKLGGKGKLIETVWGVGYRFKEHEA